MSNSVYIRARLTSAEIDRLKLSPERGIRSISALAGQIVRQWLDDAHRQITEPSRDASGLTLAHRIIARRRLRILQGWKKARASRRGRPIPEVTRGYLRSLKSADRVSLRTLYGWELRYQAGGLAALVDHRNRPEGEAIDGRSKD